MYRATDVETVRRCPIGARWLVLVFFASALTGTSMADTPDTVDAVGTRLGETEARLQRLEREIETNRDARRSLENSMAEAAARVSERDARIRGLDVEIARYESRLAGLEAEIATQKAHVDARRQELARAVTEAYRAADTSSLQALLQHDDPVIADRLGVYAGYVLAAQREHIEREVAALTALDDAQRRAAKDRHWLQYIQRKATGQRDEARSSAESRSTALATVDRTLGDQTRTVAELRADRERLQALMTRLEAEASSASGYFASGRGEYPLPVDGRIVARFGEPKSVGRVAWDGLYIEASPRAPVTSIADGEVVYAASLSGFGMLVIVDHGDDYLSLYGGNRRIRVQPGDWVDAGATIATVGRSSGQSEAGLYFEIRHRAKPVDPGDWLASENET